MGEKKKVGVFLGFWDNKNQSAGSQHSFFLASKKDVVSLCLSLRARSLSRFALGAWLRRVKSEEESEEQLL